MQLASGTAGKPLVKKRYKHLTKEERHTIQTMKQAGSSRSEIARALGRDPTSIGRELRRNAAPACAEYDYRHAERMAMRRRRLARRPYRFDPKMAQVVIDLLERGFSPGQIEMALAEDGLSARHLYTFIELDRRAGGSLYRLLPRGRRPRRRRCRWKRGPIPHRRDIAERPRAANERTELGHWEADLVEGKGRRSYLLTLRDRKSRFGLIVRLTNKEKSTVTAALIRALKPFDRSFRSLTLDNGGEFAGHREVAAALGHPDSVFFARPYCAGDKGSLEEFNGRIRRDFPKGTDFNQVTPAELIRIQNRINLPPLRVLDRKSPLSFLDQLLRTSA